MADDHNKYSAPSGPPPSYGMQVNNNTPQHTGGTGYMVPYNGQNALRAPDPSYPGYSHNPPAGGFYAPPQDPYYQQASYGPPPSGYYAPNDRGFSGGPQPPPQQPMYYAAPYGQHPGHYQDYRGTGAGQGICAGILAVLACCCCLDFIF